VRQGALFKKKKKKKNHPIISKHWFAVVFPLRLVANRDKPPLSANVYGVFFKKIT
jgi:hypothetical protein